MSIENGMALCRLCHWAFDEGLMGVDDHYTILLSRQLATAPNAAGFLMTLAGRVALSSDLKTQLFGPISPGCHGIDGMSAWSFDVIADLVRYGFSVPIQSLACYGFIDGRYTLFDYGCGQSDDVRGLVENGLVISVRFGFSYPRITFYNRSTVAGEKNCSPVFLSTCACTSVMILIIGLFG